jgi:hypothetical protein
MLVASWTRPSSSIRIKRERRFNRGIALSRPARNEDALASDDMALLLMLQSVEPHTEALGRTDKHSSVNQRVRRSGTIAARPCVSSGGSDAPVSFNPALALDPAYATLWAIAAVCIWN